MKVAIIGASPKKDRYSYKAMTMLREHHHDVILISPVYKEIEGVSTINKMTETKDIETVTMYVGEDKSSEMLEEFRALAPKRVIFNPGSENPKLQKDLQNLGIEVLEACTLVLLATDQFE